MIADLEVRYEPAANPPTAIGCQTGTIALGRAIRATWPELKSLTPVYGCFNRRPIAGSTVWSLHAEGRALDIGVPELARELGWSLACHLVERRVLYGTMRVMWDGHIWSTEQPDQWRKLNPGSQQHLDHIHVEQFWSAARRQLGIQPVLETGLRAAHP